jgi:hypothetical protein
MAMPARVNLSLCSGRVDMNARHIIIAAALACFGLGAVSVGTSGLYTDGSRLGIAARAAPPLNIKAEAHKTSRKVGKTSKSARKAQTRKDQTRKARRHETQRDAPPAQTSAPESNAMQMQEQIPVIAVKTTREMGESIAIVDADEMSDLDRAAHPDISLAAYSIMSYLGGAAAIEPDDDAASPADEADATAEARNSYASTTPPAAPATPIALEYVLMTFACALAAAAAFRLFVV